ncbi:Gfo/Idh/MocA family oxidoreductase [Candidatus Bipolaricaulota bacterium]|nr:Gfo/Idh/MocA family oxidoreductase [Candidatus Bipolaricaulota bacterium]
MKTKFLQVGLGVRGKQWAEVIRDNKDSKLVGFVTRHLEKLKERASEIGFGSVPCFDDLDQAIEESDANVLVLVTPPEVHLEQAMKGFENGLHLLAEKPLTEDLPESIDIVKEAKEKGLKTGISMNFRYLAPSQAIRRKVIDLELGKPSFSQFTYLRHRDGRRDDLNDYPMYMENPMLLEQSVHHLDLMRYCFNSDVESVQADTWNPEWSTYEGDSNVSVLLKFENGMHVNYLGTWTSGSNRLYFRWRTDFPEGTLVQKRQFYDLYQSNFDEDLPLTGKNFKESKDVEPLEELDLPDVEAFIDDSKELLRRFLGSINDNESFETNAKDHVKTLCVVRACVESAEDGRRIKMKDFYEENGVPTSWHSS